MPALIREATVADAPDIARVHVDCWRTTYRGIVADSLLDALNYDDRTIQWQDLLSNPECWQALCTLIAETEGEIAGFADAGPERQIESGFDAELYSIYILHQRQRMGIGCKLMREIADRMTATGYRSLVVRVLAANSACKFYERLGAQRICASQIELGGDILELVTYGWYAVDVIHQT